MNFLEFAPEIMNLIIANAPCVELLLVCKDLARACVGFSLTAHRVYEDQEDVMLADVFPNADADLHICNDGLVNVRDVHTEWVVDSQSCTKITTYQYVDAEEARAGYLPGEEVNEMYPDSMKTRYMDVRNCVEHSTRIHLDRNCDCDPYMIESVKIVHIDYNGEHDKPNVIIDVDLLNGDYLHLDVWYPDHHPRYRASVNGVELDINQYMLGFDPDWTHGIPRKYVPVFYQGIVGFPFCSGVRNICHVLSDCVDFGRRFHKSTDLCDEWCDDDLCCGCATSKRLYAL